MENGNFSVPQNAVKLNLNWIDSLENCLANYGNQALTKEVMKAAGRNCSVQIFNDCEQILGKLPQSVDDLLDAMNQRRLQNHNLDSLWEKKGNTARLILAECNCILVKAALQSQIQPIVCVHKA